MLADKDIESVVRRLTQADLNISEWFIAEIDYPRAAPVEQLQSVLTNYVDEARIHSFNNLRQATTAVIADAQPQDLIVVCGSFHTISETLAVVQIA